MSSTDWALAIDFGTSNTAAAHTNPIHNSIEAVNLSNDRRSMTSSVYVASPDQISTSSVALSLALANPNGFIPAPKRLIGQNVVTVNGYEIDPIDIVSAVFRTTIERASRAHNGSAPGTLVLTHPDAWSGHEINVLTEAAARAGIPSTSIQTLSEPRAAAAYYTRNTALVPGDKIAVFDIGGGTLDLAVLQAGSSGEFNVLAAGGNNSIGGRSFDAAIRRWVDQELKFINPELLKYLRHDAKLRELHTLENAIREAKELLSDVPSATIPIQAGLHEAHLQLTRNEFDELIAPTLSRAVSITKQTLSRGGIVSPNDLTALYLTGGTSRVPALQEALKSIAPIATLDDPKAVVAQGALFHFRKTQTETEPEPTPKESTRENSFSASEPSPQLRHVATPPSAPQLDRSAPSHAKSEPQGQASYQPGNSRKVADKEAKRTLISGAATILTIFIAILVLAMFTKYQTDSKIDETKAKEAEAETRQRLADYPPGVIEMVNLRACGELSSTLYCSLNDETDGNYGFDDNGQIAFQRASLSEFPWDDLSSFLQEQSSYSSTSDDSDKPSSLTYRYSVNPSGTAITNIHDDGALYYYQQNGNAAITEYDFPNPTYAIMWAEDAGIWWD